MIKEKQILAFNTNAKNNRLRVIVRCHRSRYSCMMETFCEMSRWWAISRQHSISCSSSSAVINDNACRKRKRKFSILSKDKINDKIKVLWLPWSRAGEWPPVGPQLDGTPTPQLQTVSWSSCWTQWDKIKQGSDKVGMQYSRLDGLTERSKWIKKVVSGKIPSK